VTAVHVHAALRRLHLGKARAAILGGRIGGRRSVQPVFRTLHEAALRGRGFGIAGVEQSGELRLLERLARDRPAIATVFDVGSNVGDWALAAARLWPDAVIHAFEPTSTTFALLQDRTAGLRVSCARAAVGSVPGKATIFAVAGQPGLNSLYERDLSVQHLRMDASEVVEVITLDEYCAANGIASIDLLKLDVEGHELDVLKGAQGLLKGGGIEAIQFEFGGTNIDSRTYLRDFVRLLSPDYSISRVLVDGLEALRYAETEEVFVTANYFASRHSSRPRSG
jgi:FkbM family methyltransferase